MRKNLKRKIEKLEFEINGQVPEYIKILDKKVVKVGINFEWEGYRWYTITMNDVARYIRYNEISSLQKIGTAIGDWRLAKRLAKLLWNGIFTKLNSEQECRRTLENA